MKKLFVTSRYNLPLICLLVVAVIGVALSTKIADSQTNEELPPESPAHDVFSPDSQSDGTTGSIVEDNGDSSSGDHSDEQKSEFMAELREHLDNNLAIRDDSELSTISTDLIIVGTINGAQVKLGLPIEAQLHATGTMRGRSEVVYESNKDLRVEVATIVGNGTRMITIIDGPNAPTTYTYSLDLPEGVKLLMADGVGNALLAANNVEGIESPVGYIDIPWAYDAQGNSIPVTQTVTKTSVTLTVEHAGASYPVYADPTYYHIRGRAGR